MTYKKMKTLIEIFSDFDSFRKIIREGRASEGMGQGKLVDIAYKRVDYKKIFPHVWSGWEYEGEVFSPLSFLVTLREATEFDKERTKHWISLDGSYPYHFILESFSFVHDSYEGDISSGLKSLFDYKIHPFRPALYHIGSGASDKGWSKRQAYKGEYESKIFDSCEIISMEPKGLPDYFVPFCGKLEIPHGQDFQITFESKLKGEYLKRIETKIFSSGEEGYRDRIAKIPSAKSREKYIRRI